jgi:hypothetical protein
MCHASPAPDPCYASHAPLRAKLASGRGLTPVQVNEDSRRESRSRRARGETRMCACARGAVGHRRACCACHAWAHNLSRRGAPLAPPAFPVALVFAGNLEPMSGHRKDKISCPARRKSHSQPEVPAGHPQRCVPLGTTATAVAASVVPCLTYCFHIQMLFNIPVPPAPWPQHGTHRRHCYGRQRHDGGRALGDGSRRLFLSRCQLIVVPRPVVLDLERGGG